MKNVTGLTLQTLSTRERIILLLAAAVAVVFFVTRGAPIVTTVYSERAGSIESVKLDIERELRLQDSAALWSSRRDETERALASAEAGQFTGAITVVGFARNSRAESAKLGGSR